MKIAEIRIEPCDLAKDDPEWRFALAANPLSQGWAVSITAEDGTTGYGYGSAMPHYGAPVGAVKANLDNFKETLMGRDSRRIAELLWELDRQVVGNNQAKAAIDCALHDLLARRLDIPLCELFGGAVREEFVSLRILPIKSPADMAAGARALMDKGFNHFKIKVHGNVEEDIARVAAIREEVGADAGLTIDANQSYAPKDAIRAITAMAEFGIDLAEQPVAAGDLRGLKLVTDSVPVTVEADEAADSLAQVAALVRARAVDAVSLKITKLGGLRNTVAAARICEAGGIRYRIGAHVGPRVLAAHAMHMAATLPGIWYACELAEFDRLLDDPFEGIELEGGLLRLPEAPGCGVAPRPESTLARAAG
ncbi:MAG: mandelate racemase/muconate lactonizing enzyme family protein [Alphaproteobacteria bacterium]